MNKYAVLYSEKIKEYKLEHVLTADRYQNFMDLYQEKLGSRKDFEIIVPDSATNDDLKLIHTEEYIQRIEQMRSLDPYDTPLSNGLVRAARLLAGAGKLAGELVCSGQYRKAFVVGGGVQHANRNQEKGFGVFSDIGICAENLKLKFGFNKILIVDTDAHAGEGLYEIFAGDPKVLLISIHQDPETLYPGKGFIHEIGSDEGVGYSVNIPLPPKSGDRVYKLVLEKIVVPLAEEFHPQIILMVDGSDPHYTDRLTRMGLTLRGIRMIGQIISAQAEKLCDGKLVDFIGSGYSSDSRIIPMGWLASISGVSGVDLAVTEPDPVPTEFKSDHGLEETQKIIELIRKQLAYYWKCFS